MSAAVPLTQAGPLERVAHRVGVALLRWSESRAVRTVAPSTLTSAARAHSAARLAHEQRTALEARHQHWDTLAAGTPRVR